MKSYGSKDGQTWASFVGVTIFCIVVGVLYHRGLPSWAFGLALAGIISELRELGLKK